MKQKTLDYFKKLHDLDYEIKLLSKENGKILYQHNPKYYGKLQGNKQTYTFGFNDFKLIMQTHISNKISSRLFEAIFKVIVEDIAKIEF